MAEMDQAIKRILQRHIDTILRHFFPDIHYVEALPTDVGMEKQLILDSLSLAECDEEQCAVNLEAQTESRAELLKKIRRYAGRVYDVHGLETLSIVLLLTDKGPRPDEWTTFTVGKTHPLALGSLRVFVLALYEMSADAMIEKKLLPFLPLTPLMQGATQETAKAAMQTIKGTMTADEQIIEASLLAVFIARQFTQEVAKAIFQEVFMSDLLTQLIHESPLYQEWIAHAKEQGEAQGRAEGEAQGRAEGEAQGEARGRAALLMGAWQERFGAVPEEVAQALAHVDAATAVRILRALMQPDMTIEHVRQMLPAAS